MRRRVFPTRSALVLVLLCAAGIGNSQAQLVPSLLATASRLIPGPQGGAVSKGMWTVSVPPGAYAGIGTVSVQVSPRDPSVCLLGIVPAALNSFRVPVRLTAKLPLGTKATSQVIQYFDPQSKTRINVPGSTADPSSGTVIAPLWHFSEYRVSDGRAGW